MTDVHLIVPEGYTWFFVNADDNAMDRIDRILDEAMKYEEPDAQYTTAYKRGTWDGFVHVYNRDKHGAPMGLMGRAERLLEANNYSVTTEIEGDRTGDRVDAEWTGAYELRDYQREAVDAVLENRGGIVALPTGTGKTVTAMRLLYELTPIAGRSLVLVHTGELLYQWAEEIRTALGVEPGVIGDGNWSEGPVTVATLQTLMQEKDSGEFQLTDLEGNYGTIVFDECHTTSAADRMHQVGMEIDTAFRIGLSATPWRKVDGEELKIEGAVGDSVYDASAETMIDKGHLAKPEFEVIENTETHFISEYHDAYRKYIALSPERNNLLAKRCSELVESDTEYKTLVNVNRIAHGKLLEYALNSSMTGREALDEIRDNDDEPADVVEKVEAIEGTQQYGDYGAVFLSGSDSTDRRQEVMQRFEDGEIPVLISTLLREGVDIPTMNAIVLAHGGKSDTQTIQVIGRSLRPSGDGTAKVIDVHDHGIFFEDAYEERQRTMAEYYGKYGPEFSSSGSSEDAKEEARRQDSTIDLTEEMTEEEQANLLDSMGLNDE